MTKPANFDPLYGEQLGLSSALGSEVSGDITGTVPGPSTVTGIQGYPVSSTAPGTGQTLVWNGSAYVPQPIGVQFAQTIGDGTHLTYTVAHGLTSLDVIVQVLRVSDGANVWCSVTRPDTGHVAVGFSTVPSANSYRVLCSGA